MKRFFFTMLLVMTEFASMGQYTQGDPPASIHDPRTQDITAHTRYFLDSSRTLQPEQAIRQTYAPLSDFILRKRVPHELVSSILYLQFNISNPGPDTLRYYFYPGMYYQKLTLYATDSSLREPLAQIGNGSNGFVYLSIAPQQPRTFLLRAVFTRSDYNFVSARLITPDHLPGFIKQLSNYATVRKMVGFLFAGCMFMLFVFCLLNFFSLRRIEFLHNAVFSFCMFLIMLSYAAFYNMPGSLPGEFFGHWWLILLNAGYIFYIQFTRKFLNTAEQYPLLNKLFLSEIIILVVLIVLHSFVHYFSNSSFWSYTLQNAMKITVVGISFVYIVLGLENKNRLMNYLAIGCAIQVICAVIALALVPISADSPHLFTSSLFYFELGTVVSQVFFLVGLSYKHRSELVDEIRYKEALRANEEKASFETKLAIMEAKQAERNRISADMHDDLGSGMTTIRLFSELAKRKLGDQQLPEIDKISSSANELLVKMNAIIWSMSSSNDTLDNMVAYIRSYALEFLENTGIGCQVHLPDRIPKMVVHGEIRRNVFLVVKETLNNIVKHSGASEADIRMNKEPQGLSLVIHDNGRGIDFEKIGRFGNGLQNMKKRMDDIGIEFSILSHNGTSIRLYMKTRD